MIISIKKIMLLSSQIMIVILIMVKKYLKILEKLLVKLSCKKYNLVVKIYILFRLEMRKK